MNTKHTPVLADAAIEAMQIVADGKYIDATAGQGGHLRLILDKGGEVLAIDADKTQIAELEKASEFSRVQFQVGNFSEIDQIAQSASFAPVESVLFDFGLSYRQLAVSGRGFSYKNLDEPLDMRLNTDSEITAADLLATLSAEEIYRMLSLNAEEYHARSIAETIVRYRKRNPIRTVGDLIVIIDHAVSPCTRGHRHGSDVYTKVFQALRIEVNHEYEAIEKGLTGALRIVKPGGRIVAITFHSGEDRIVKSFGRKHKLKELTRSPLRGDYTKSFSRGAKMRILQTSHL